jgi:hypothetical protein
VTRLISNSAFGFQLEPPHVVSYVKEQENRPLLQFLAQFFHRQTDDVAVGAGDFGTESVHQFLKALPGTVETHLQGGVKKDAKE